MPTYDFKCPECRTTLEVVVPAKEMPAWKACPECGRRMNRVFALPAIVFKGDNWPGRDLKRRNEDSVIRGKVRKAKKLKTSGQVPQDEVLKLEDRILED